MKATSSLILIQSIVLAVAMQDGVSKTCYQTSKNPNKLFGTKTSYSAVSGNNLNSPTGCIPKQVWMLGRHGTRSPSDKKIKDLKVLEDIKDMITDKTTMCDLDVHAIKSWKLDLTNFDDYKIVNQGFKELCTLSDHLKERLPQLFNRSYDSKTYTFLSSPKSRSTDCAKMFFESMFDRKLKKDNIPTVDESDHLLCLEKDELIVDDEEEQKQSDKFKKSTHMQSVVESVSKAMGLEQNLSHKIVLLMWDSCGYEIAMDIESKPAWCAVFTKVDFEILEYLDDLKEYYTMGYGNPKHENLGCPILKDLIDNFKTVAKNETSPLGIFYFAHSGNILSLLRRLEIGKDNTLLTYNNFEDMKDRNWRVSKLDPFAANILAVFFSCLDGNKVMFLLNEHAIPMHKDLPLLSPWHLIEAQFDPIISNESCVSKTQLP